ncbi:response regulator [Corticibacterium sp. UT-5YL-CI-8]|nr:response regulator [Tianweitania sp. UT-5YL-CI-8]
MDCITVLLVEDEILIRMDVAGKLRNEGFEVLEAGNANEAIRILEHDDAVRVLSDIDMPGSMDGLKLSAAIRDRWPPIKIVVTSGHRMVEITDLPDGSVFFPKPYSHTRVATTMRELLCN